MTRNQRRRALLLVWAAGEGIGFEPRPKRYPVACPPQVLVRVGSGSFVGSIGEATAGMILWIRRRIPFVPVSEPSLSSVRLPVESPSSPIVIRVGLSGAFPGFMYPDDPWILLLLRRRRIAR